MGMFTEFCLNVDLRPDVDDGVITWLKAMFYPKEILDGKLDTDLHFDHCLMFKEPDDVGLVMPSKWYTDIVRKDCRWVIQIMMITEYPDGIDAFLKWITPHVDPMWCSFAGYSRYEDAMGSTPISFIEGKLNGPWPPTCDECENAREEPHACPFKVDVKNDESTLCRCCKECTYQCGRDI